MLYCSFLPTTSFQFKSILVHDGAALVSELSQFINPDCVLHVIQMLIFNPGLRQLYIPTTEQDDTITRRRPVQANRIHFFSYYTNTQSRTMVHRVAPRPFLVLLHRHIYYAHLLLKRSEVAGHFFFPFLV